VALSKTHIKRPNLLFITVDDMNWSIPGFMGNKHGLTPNLDALAVRSHRFERNRTTAPICQPSREAMMTGRVPHRSGGLGFDPIHEGVPTLVTVLQSAGYYTAAIHKTEHMQPDSCFPWDQKVIGINRRPSEYRKGVSDAIAAAKKSNKPFFVNCNINDPHRPFYGSPEAAELDHNDTGEYAAVKEVKPDDVDVPPILEDLPPVRKELSQYYNSAQRMDVSVGLVLSALRDSGEEASTIVLFSADHGMPFPFSKATTYDYGTRTPALLRYPEMGRPTRFADSTCNIDYKPTLLDLMRVPKPDGMDGQSWIAIMQGKTALQRDFVITHVNDVSSGSEFPMRAIQDHRYSLMFTPWSDGKTHLRIESMIGLTFPAMRSAAENDPQIADRIKQYVLGMPLSFYDLQLDPGQRTNLLDLPEYQERISRMKQALHESMKATGDPQLDNFELLLGGRQPVVAQPAVLKFSPQPEPTKR
jgi:N-sulfoglucosamine sulfohydrolase